MKTILVLEDDEPVLNLLRCLLQKYNVIDATTAEQALRVLDENGSHIHLFLSDVRLPKSSGIQVALRIRSKVPGVPVILTSGYSVSDFSDRDFADLKKLGESAVTILQKPFQAEELSDAVRELIGSRETVRTA